MCTLTVDIYKACSSCIIVGGFICLFNPPQAHKVEWRLVMYCWVHLLLLHTDLGMIGLMSAGGDASLC